MANLSDTGGSPGSDTPTDTQSDAETRRLQDRFDQTDTPDDTGSDATTTHRTTSTVKRGGTSGGAGSTSRRSGDTETDTATDTSSGASRGFRSGSSSTGKVTTKAAVTASDVEGGSDRVRSFFHRGLADVRAAQSSAKRGQAALNEELNNRRTRGMNDIRAIRQSNKQDASLHDAARADRRLFEDAAKADAAERAGGSDAPIKFYRKPNGQVEFTIGESPAVTKVQQSGTRVTFGDALKSEYTTPNTDILDSLTSSKGEGYLSNKQEQTLRNRAAAIRNGPLNLSDEFDSFVRNLTGSETAGAVASGVGKLPSELVASVDDALLAGDVATEAGQNFKRTVDKFGLEPTLQASGETVGLAGEATASQIAAKPFESAGEIGGGILLGSAAFKGLEKAGDIASSANTLRKADAVVNVEDLTDAAKVGQTSGSNYPEFSQGAVADTEKALKEFQDAADNAPAAVKEATGGDSVIYHGTEQGPFPGTGTVTPGARSEISGQYFAADLSKLRLRGGSSSLPSSWKDLKPRLPKLGSDREIVATSSKIDSVPDIYGGDRTPGVDLDKPITETDIFGRKRVTGREKGSVSKYITSEGGNGESFVLPKGTRTAEQEAVIPEGTVFTETGDKVAVKMGRGDYIPLRSYRYGKGTESDLANVGKALDSDMADIESSVRSLPSSRIDRTGSVGTAGALAGGAFGTAATVESALESDISSMDVTPSVSESVSPSDTGPSLPSLSDVLGDSPGSSPFDETVTGPPSRSPSGGSPGSPSGPGEPSTSTPSEPSGGSPSGGSGGPSGGSPPTYPDNPTGSSKPPIDELKSDPLIDPALKKDLEDVRRNYGTGIASVDDLLGK